MKKTIILIPIMLILIMISVKADIPNIFETISEAEELKGDTDHTLNDDQYGTHISVFSDLGDGDTGSTAEAKGDQTIRFIYDIDGLTDGNYTLRVYFKSDESTMIIYAYTNETAINTSINKTATNDEANHWQNYDITDLVKYSFNKQGRVGLRIAKVSSDSVIGETYLRQPITEATVDFLAQGVEISTIERWTENSWKIIADVNLEIEGINCIVERIDENHTHVMPVPADTFFDNDNQLFGMTWYTNESQINESFSYRTNCDVTIEGITFTDIYQYVYITREKSMWEAFGQLWQYITGFMTNILISIEGTANETLNITKEINKTTKQTNETTHQINETTTETQNTIQAIFDYLFGGLTNFLMNINTTTTDTNEIVNQINTTTTETKELIEELNFTTSGGNNTQQLNRIEEKLDNLSQRPFFNLISR